MPKALDLTGHKFGSWTVLRRVPTPAGAADKSARWLCRCRCGAEKVVRSAMLRSGESTRCSRACRGAAP